MGKLYFSDRECREAGFSVAMIATLRTIADFVDTQTELAAAQAELEAAQGDIADQGDAIDAANTDIAAANAAINTLDGRVDGHDTDITALEAADTALDGRLDTAEAALVSLDGRIDAYDALAPFVRQNQAARPSYTPYAGQDVSAAYVEAEAQATDDAVLALSTAFSTLLTRLDTVNLLT